MSNRTAPGIAMQSPRAADCRHVREPFDQAFHVVAHRADLSTDARLLHAFLVSLHRTGRMLTQLQMAEEAGLTRHRVWAALRELVAADLVQSVRYGLGRPNRYVLLGLDAADLDGKASPETGVRPVRRPQSGQSGNPARGYVLPQEKPKERGYIRPGQHAGYGRVARSSSELMQSRQGPVPRRT